MRRHLGVAVAAAVAGAVGLAVADLGVGMLCAACVLIVLDDTLRPHGAPPWPTAPEELPGQVGHPLVRELITDFERADRDAVVLRRLDLRVTQALQIPGGIAPRRAADLHRVLTGAEQARD